MVGKDVRPGRKIGHVTVCGDAAGRPDDRADLDALRARAKHATDYLAGVIDQ